MKTTIALSIALSISSLIMFGCGGPDRSVSTLEHTDKPEPAPTIDAPQIELKGNLNAADFKSALVGKWISAFTYENKRNVQDLEFRADGTARIVITQGAQPKAYTGPYAVSFVREPKSDATTRATITISPKRSDPIVLSPVSFNLHNGVHTMHGMPLRIDKEPHGVLKRNN
jgi:hypothetical protein